MLVPNFNIPVYGSPNHLFIPGVMSIKLKDNNDITNVIAEVANPIDDRYCFDGTVEFWYDFLPCLADEVKINVTDLRFWIANNNVMDHILFA